MERSRSAALIIRKVCASGIWRSVSRQTRTTHRGATGLGGKWADEGGGAATSGRTIWDQLDHVAGNDRTSDGSPGPECGMGWFPFGSGVNAAEASVGQGSASSVASWHHLRWRLRPSEPTHPYARLGMNRPLVNDEYLRERLILLWKTPLGSTGHDVAINQTEQGAFNIKRDDLNCTCPTSSMDSSTPLEASSVKRKRKKKMNKHKQRKLRRRERNKNENKR
eukprot:TRINITY_DN1982_c0_g2_i1.p1 TRINITY_DN1982_c0_g2~~TRINITY_DN1982_c0_g2_i1.p1  ORF type:complete len:222 (+),score=22.42 TRINITY_DN1982_c0_g2_i1:301-966(+)